MTRDPLAEQFVELILAELESQDVSISELARRLGVSQQVASRTLNRDGSVTTRTIVDYCNALGLTPQLGTSIGVASA